MPGISPETAEFALVAFEGPDEYSRAGGLAVRVRDLAETLSVRGFATHLYFVGDPNLTGVEARGNLTLHRWCQWISAHHPGGVYDGEIGKIRDLISSLPGAIVDQVGLATARGKKTVFMSEDWQMAPVTVAVYRALALAGLHQQVVPVWTANNIYGLDGIDFSALSDAAGIMTVSRYMKHAMRSFGLNPIVSHNGISPSAIIDVPSTHVKQLRRAFGDGVSLFKIGRYSPDKGWIQAVEAAAMLKHAGIRVRMLIRGDRGRYGDEVLSHAGIHGLRVQDLTDRYSTLDALASGIASLSDADVLNLRSFLPDDLLPPLYAAVDGVIANSVFEPFGLVGLEVMGCGGCVFVGSTGEDYAEPDANAVVLETHDPREIVFNLLRLQSSPKELKAIKKRARDTAKRFVWPIVIDQLLNKLEYVAMTRNVEVYR